MHTEKRDAPDPNFNYETRDVNYKGLRTANLIFFAFAIGSAVVGYFLYSIWANPALYRTEGKDVVRVYPKDPNPLLQDNVTAKTDIMDMRQAEDAKLGAAPIQNRNGSYQIPINAAKAIIVGGHARGAVNAAAVEGVPQTDLLIPSEPVTELNPPALPRGTGGQE